MQIEPKTANLVPLRDLAVPLGCTQAAVYNAAKRGHIPIVSVGASKKMTLPAFEYHAENGFGPDVPPYSPEVGQ